MILIYFVPKWKNITEKHEHYKYNKYLAEILLNIFCGPLNRQQSLHRKNELTKIKVKKMCLATQCEFNNWYIESVFYTEILYEHNSHLFSHT